ncbi:Subtilisin-like protease SBT1.2 [Ananas comosus]|uniref:Subtilisin-like protease SBT1.2 n=1 Tax=Ananas comosus TaxID=4615 RepID=A0A199UFR3_ANACO|nr:Subtilisin-like protease SBT1.2 [Ananas comosus]
MASPKVPLLLLLLVLCSSSFLSFLPSAVVVGQETRDGGDDELKRYLVLVRRPEGVAQLEEAGLNEGEADPAGWYSSLLSSVVPIVGLSSVDDNNNDAPGLHPRLIYSFQEITTGFGASLTEKELEAMKTKEWFLTAIPDRMYQLMTTHTPQFLGLRRRNRGVWNTSNMGEGVIIAVLDSGIAPDHPSFDDTGMPPPPARWKGRCDFKNGSATCNNKIIGARSFIDSKNKLQSRDAPFDIDGHGTHTASTAGGNFVRHANVFGQARGIAAGVAPRAHVAIYKVCEDDLCGGLDIACGMEAALCDGADILSLSLGGQSLPFWDDLTAVGAYGAIQKGVFVSCSGGNSGPDPKKLSNEAPWILTVAASTMDRQITSTVKLGNGIEFDGETLNQPRDFGQPMLPLVFAGAIGGSTNTTSQCLNGTLDGVDIRGKIVLCERGGSGRTDKGNVVLAAGGAGMILMNGPNDGYSTLADPHVLPASHISYADGNKIKEYINSTASPTATFLFKGTRMRTPRSPAITSFSSRGPNKQSPGILKPDITGPGVSVLAAWPVPPVKTLTTRFNMISGTSMSAPHLSGVAALIKSAHPNWSPAAIKSAMMTTAYVTDRRGNPILDERRLPADYFALGSGHIDPQKALNPGLVYDIAPEDYISYLCGLGYSDIQLTSVVAPQSHASCAGVKNITEGELNYPSITVTLAATPPRSVRYIRTVTNVGEAPTTYRPEIEVPEGVSVRVKPLMLQFSKVNQKKRFRIIFRRTGGVSGVVQGQLKWVSDKHVVRSPISIYLA